MSPTMPADRFRPFQFLVFKSCTSSTPTANERPSGEYASAILSSPPNSNFIVWLCNTFPFCQFHTVNLLSVPATASRVPSGENATNFAPPFNVQDFSTLLVEQFQTEIVPSISTVRRKVPTAIHFKSRENSTARTSTGGGSGVAFGLGVGEFAGLGEDVGLSAT